MFNLQCLAGLLVSLSDPPPKPSPFRGRESMKLCIRVWQSWCQQDANICAPCVLGCHCWPRGWRGAEGTARRWCQWTPLFACFGRHATRMIPVAEDVKMRFSRQWTLIVCLVTFFTGWFFIYKSILGLPPKYLCSHVCRIIGWYGLRSHDIIQMQERQKWSGQKGFLILAQCTWSDVHKKLQLT